MQSKRSTSRFFVFPFDLAFNLFEIRPTHQDNDRRGFDDSSDLIVHECRWTHFAHLHFKNVRYRTLVHTNGPRLHVLDQPKHHGGLL